VFIDSKDDGGGGDNWSYKSCKAPVISSPPTKQHPVILQAGCPSCRPTNSVKALKGRACNLCHFNTTISFLFSLQCFDTVGWATGRESGL